MNLWCVLLLSSIPLFKGSSCLVVLHIEERYYVLRYHFIHTYIHTHTHTHKQRKINNNQSFKKKHTAGIFKPLCIKQRFTLNSSRTEHEASSRIWYVAIFSERVPLCATGSPDERAWSDRCESAADCSHPSVLSRCWTARGTNTSH